MLFEIFCARELPGSKLACFPRAQQRRMYLSGTRTGQRVRFFDARIPMAPDAADNGLSTSIDSKTSSPVLKGCPLLFVFSHSSGDFASCAFLPWD
jgi:hypothetical protein